MPRFPLAAALAAFCCAGAVLAQQATPPAAGASAARPGAARVGSDYTPGWSMMTAEERDAHRERMLSAGTLDECRRIRDDELKRSAQRARARGVKEVPNPRHDACSGY